MRRRRDRHGDNEECRPAPHCRHQHLRRQRSQRTGDLAVDRAWAARELGDLRHRDRVEGPATGTCAQSDQADTKGGSRQAQCRPSRVADQLDFSETVGPGIVFDQDPKPIAGDQAWGSKVVLYVSKGPHPRIVPALYDLPLNTAIADLHARQLKYALAPWQPSTSVPQGDVISQNPLEKASVGRYHVVSLVVSLGEPYVKIPHLRGLSVKRARSDLGHLGLLVQVYGPGSGGTVLFTDPSQGSSIREGQTVTLYTI